MRMGNLLLQPRLTFRGHKIYQTRLLRNSSSQEGGMQNTEGYVVCLLLFFLLVLLWFMLPNNRLRSQEW
jgi:hypothetical protein